MIFPYCRRNSERISSLVGGEDFHCHRRVHVERGEYMEKFGSGLSYNIFYCIFIILVYVWLVLYLPEASLNSSSSGSTDRECLAGASLGGCDVSGKFHCSGSQWGLLCLYLLPQTRVKIIYNGKYIHPESKSGQRLTWDYELCFFAHKLL